MSTGKLKAQYNRVRTSTALHTTSIWSNTIGLQQDQAGTNSAIEASIYAPGGGGRGREAKRQRAQELIEATGFQPSVRDFDQLKALARRSGGDAAALNRGACKICGGLGHLTKQCRNFLDKGSGGAAAAGTDGGADELGGQRQLLTQEAEDALLLDSDSMDSSDLGSDSDGGGDRKRRRKERSSRDKERSGSSRKHKKEKSSRKEKKAKKEKKVRRDKDRRSRSRSRSRDRTDRRRERSRSRSLDRRA